MIVDGEEDTGCIFVWGVGRGMSDKGDSSSRCCFEAAVLSLAGFCLGDDVFLWEEVGGALEYHIPRDVSGMVLTRLSVAPKENEASELLGVSRRRF